MCLLVQLTVLGAQSGLVMWKKRHKRSYELVQSHCSCPLQAPPRIEHEILSCCSLLGCSRPDKTLFPGSVTKIRVSMLCGQVTLLGLWLVPVVISMYFHFWRFVGIWAIFSSMTCYILYTCVSKRIDRTTPRRVKTLSLVHQHLTENSSQNKAAPICFLQG